MSDARFSFLRAHHFSNFGDLFQFLCSHGSSNLIALGEAKQGEGGAENLGFKFGDAPSFRAFAGVSGCTIGESTDGCPEYGFALEAT